MDVLTLSRLQFAVTTLFHYIFVPLTLGLAFTVALMQTAYFITGDDIYKRMTKFWGKLFIINFAIGVVTGIVQEFQFGMNWSEYSRFVGDIFGAPLAIEALMAFFLESVFIGVWIFGWDRLKKSVHLAAIWVVALASNISALWILAANSWMQNPVGYEIVNGRAQMTDFFALLTNPYLSHMFTHVLSTALVTSAAFVLGISAYRLVRAREEVDLIMFGRSFKIAAGIGLVSIALSFLTGHAQAQYLANHQPMKLAAAEGLWESEDPASLSLFQIGDETNNEAIFNIRFPWLLSLLAFDTPSGEVLGLNPLNEMYQEMYGPGDYIPNPIYLTYWSFRIMVGVFTVMTILILTALWKMWRGTLLKSPRFMAVLVFAITLPHLANGTGWLLTEMGRQPWIVHGLMRTEAGISPALTVTDLTISLIGFTLVYSMLVIAEFFLLWKYGSGGTSTGDILPNTDEGYTADDLSLEGAY